MATIEAPPATAETEEKDELFDKADYDAPELRLDTIDEATIDDIEITFTGTVTLNRRNKASCRLIRELKLGKRLNLHVDGLTVSKAFKAKRDPDSGWAKKTVLSVGARVDGIDVGADLDEVVAAPVSDSKKNQAAD
jgi:hypothetical protein